MSRPAEGEGESGTDSNSERLAELERRIARLEAQIDDESDDERAGESDDLDAVPWLDRRDRPVIEWLDDGDVVPRHVLEDLYRRRTPIKRDETIDQRIRNLASQHAFENVRPGIWEFHEDRLFDEVES